MHACMQTAIPNLPPQTYPLIPHTSTPHRPPKPPILDMEIIARDTFHPVVSPSFFSSLPTFEHASSCVSAFAEPASTSSSAEPRSSLSSVTTIVSTSTSTGFSEIERGSVTGAGAATADGDGFPAGSAGVELAPATREAYVRARERVRAVEIERERVSTREGEGESAGEGQGEGEREGREGGERGRPGDDIVVIPTGTSSAVVSRFRNGEFFLLSSSIFLGPCSISPSLRPSLPSSLSAYLRHSPSFSDLMS